MLLSSFSTWQFLLSGQNVTCNLIGMARARHQKSTTLHALSCPIFEETLATRLPSLLYDHSHELTLASYPGSCGEGEKRAWY